MDNTCINVRTNAYIEFLSEINNHTYYPIVKIQIIHIRLHKYMGMNIKYTFVYIALLLKVNRI